MGAASFMAADWGSSHLRLYLCAGQRVLDHCDGPGIAATGSGHARVLRAAIEPWRAMHGPLPLLMAGMVGSRNGWVEVPYVECPADAATLRAALHRFRADDLDVAIVPGLACTNPLGAPDVMRGEETQLLGALALQPQLASGRRVFALPGTHCKWVEVADGRIVRFQTSFIGELYALLRAHSLLAGSSDAPHDAQAFDFGLQRAGEVEDAGGGLAHALFEARSRQLRAGMAPAAADAFLSGLLIGSDVHGMRAMLGAAMDAPVALIATSALAERYAQALQRYGYATQALDGAGCVLAGLRALAE